MFRKGLKGEPVTEEEQDKYKGYILTFLAKEYAKYGWVLTQAANQLNSTLIALSGRNAGRTFTLSVLSAFIFLCHSSESTGSSVVHTVLTL